MEIVDPFIAYYPKLIKGFEQVGKTSSLNVWFNRSTLRYPPYPQSQFFDLFVSMNFVAFFQMLRFWLM